MSFSELGLNEALLSAVAREGYSTPTPIQQKAIPAVLSGQDLMAAAQTGTGKTAAFTLPILHKLVASEARRGKAPRVLILTPTRELAAQVAESVETYGRDVRPRSAVIFGGVSPRPQIAAIQKGLDLLVATPGRLLDHVREGHLDLSAIEVFVLDEADRMLDMGFVHDIKRVIKELPAQRQNLLFSATFSDDIRKLAKRLLNDPTEINVTPKNSTAETIAQSVIHVEKRRKRALLSWLVGSNNWQQVLVFTRTKHGANRLCKQLESDGLTAAALHGNKSQNARTNALNGFKAGTVRVLVATDIAARGIDIDQLPHVINFELPNVPEDYVHRIGRTGRAGVEGEALSLVDGEEAKLLKGIERLIGRRIPVREVEGFDMNAPLPAQERDERGPRPSRPPRNNGSRGGQQQKSRNPSRGGQAHGGEQKSAPSGAKRRRRPRRRAGGGQSN
ncbi:DEAD/DEAH box helicase [uncultured Abyssibacter sp.]|uniref:DEAD/DEAH box helicase n=1 Tax=uncultured Abyssibacter sp. TaxID=2320202 RepID=UPI0032B1AEAD